MNELTKNKLKYNAAKVGQYSAAVLGGVLLFLAGGITYELKEFVWDYVDRPGTLWREGYKAKAVASAAVCTVILPVLFLLALVTMILIPLCGAQMLIMLGLGDKAKKCAAWITVYQEIERSTGFVEREGSREDVQNESKHYGVSTTFNSTSTECSTENSHPHVQ